MTDNKIDRETAEGEFERFKAAMRLRLDRENMDENDRRDVGEDVEIIIEEIMAGRITINDEGEAVFYPESGDALTFKKPKGGVVAVIDKKKESHKVAQNYAIMGALCGTHPAKIQAMDWADIDICASIVSLFFVR